MRFDEIWHFATWRGATCALPRSSAVLAIRSRRCCPDRAGDGLPLPRANCAAISLVEKRAFTRPGRERAIIFEACPVRSWRRAGIGLNNGLGYMYARDRVRLSCGRQKDDRCD